MPEPRLAIIIATKDRPQLVRRLLDSLARQSSPPAQVIVVDGGSSALPLEPSAFPGLVIRSARVTQPALTKQKNVGVRLLDPHISLVAFLDDDIILEEKALEAMAAFWDHAGPELGGAGFSAPNERSLRALWFKRLFGLDDLQQGRILPSGCNTPLCPQPEPYRTQWLRGGITVWRREVVEAYAFDEWFPDNGYLEDVDYSLRVGRQYGFMMVSEARARHDSIPLTWRGQFRFGIHQVINRFYVVQKHPELSLGWYLWSLPGQAMVNMTAGVVDHGWRGMARTMGNLVGWGAIALGRMPARRRLLQTARPPVEASVSFPASVDVGVGKKDLI